MVETLQKETRHAAPPQAAPARQDEDKDVHLRDNIGNCEGHDDPADKKLRHHVKPDHDEVINYNLLY